MGKMLDTFQADRVVAELANLKSDGYTAIASYYFRSSGFKQLLTRAVAKHISDAGLWNVSVWENGRPTSGGYFSAERGGWDGTGAAECAVSAGQPQGTPVYLAVDYDASSHDLGGIDAYFRAAGGFLRSRGYKVGVYGSGLVCGTLTHLGLVEYTWLSMSKGFTGYQSWRAQADIVQGAGVHFLGIDADTDVTGGHGGGWKVT